MAAMTQDFRYSMRTHVGRVRKANEDAIIALPEQHLWAVSDGMGGHENGAFASNTVTEMIAALPEDLSGGELMQEAREAILRAHQAIQEESARNGGATIGATVVMLLVSGAHAACLWAGDSRLYLLRSGQITRVSRDHSLVADLVDAGQLSDDEAENHPHSNVITRAVGVGESLEIEKRRADVMSGDRFLLCSDGLTKYASDSLLRDVLAEEPIETVADRLLQIALEGGGSDNISVIVVEVPEIYQDPEQTVVPG